MTGGLKQGNYIHAHRALYFFPCSPKDIIPLSAFLLSNKMLTGRITSATLVELKVQLYVKMSSVAQCQSACIAWSLCALSLQFTYH